MGVFWSYFRDTLRLPFILKRGALALLAEGGALVLDAAREIVISLRDQFCPERCETAMLERFAHSRGIVRAPLEPESSYHGRVRFAYLWWLRGGTEAVLAQVLMDYFGFAEVRVVNLRAEDAIRWAEFRVEVAVVGGQAMFDADQVVWAINEVKPARSKLAEVQYIYSIEGPVPAWSVGAMSAGVTTVWPQ